MISLLCWWAQILQQDADAAQNIYERESLTMSSLFIGTAVSFQTRECHTGDEKGGINSVIRKGKRLSNT
jgi:hypothetical protein